MTTMAMVSADTASDDIADTADDIASKTEDGEKQQLLSTFKQKAKDKVTARDAIKKGADAAQKHSDATKDPTGRPPAGAWRRRPTSPRPRSAGRLTGRPRNQAERLGRIILGIVRGERRRRGIKCGNVTKTAQAAGVGRRGGEDNLDEHVRGDEEEAEVGDGGQPRQARRHQEARAQGVQQARDRVDEGDGDVVWRDQRRRPPAAYKNARSRARRSPLTRSRARWRRRRSPRPRTTRRAARSRWPNTGGDGVDRILVERPRRRQRRGAG